MPKFGDTWKSQPAEFWDGMWAKHHDSQMTAEIVNAMVQADRVLELGCGAGHLFDAAARAGFSGVYTGVEISRAALRVFRKRQSFKDLGSRGRLIHGDFLVLAAEGALPGVDVVVARGVIQHQQHWMPMALAALRLAPEILLGSGYSVERGTRHLGGWQRPGHFDWRICEEHLAKEARAAGVNAETRHYPNPRRPKYRECLITVRR